MTNRKFYIVGAGLLFIGTGLLIYHLIELLLIRAVESTITSAQLPYQTHSNIISKSAIPSAVLFLIAGVSTFLVPVFARIKNKLRK
jgi:hypothetical protein